MSSPNQNSSFAVSFSKLLSVKNNKISTLQILLVLIALAVLYVFPAYYFPLIDMDEGAYATVSREMVVNGNWFTTMLNGQPFFDKPVLMYWTQSIGLLIFGDERFSYRFPSLVAYFTWLYVSYQFVKNYLSMDTAWIFLWISIFSLGALLSFKAAIPDAWLILFISLGIYKAYEFIVENDDRALLWAFAWTGFGVLAKGPVALVIVAGSMFFFLLMGRNWRLLVKSLFFWKGWLLFIVIVTPWYLLQTYLFGQIFIDDFFGVQNVGRFMNAMDSHNGNAFYYIFDLVFLTLPFAPILLKSMIPWFKESKQSSFELMMLTWFLLVLVFFTVAATKLPHYLMYGVPPVLIMMAYYFQKMKMKWGLGATLIAFASLLLALPQLIEYAAKNEKNPYHYATLHEASAYLPDFYYLWLAIMLLIGLVIIVVSWDKIVKLFLAGAISALTFNYALFAYAVNLQQGPIIGAADYVKANHLKVITCCIEMPSFNIEAQQFTPMRMPKEGEIVFGKKYELEKRFTKVKWLFIDRGVAIAKIIKE